MQWHWSVRFGPKLALALASCAASIVATCALADARSDATRINYLIMKGYCSSSSTCQNPRGKEVDHIVPLWAGGADDPVNMQLISREAHLAKTQAEQAVRNQMIAAIRGGGTPRLQSPDGNLWAKGAWAGVLLRPLDDGRMLVRLDLTRQLGEGGEQRVPLVVAVPLAGLERAGDGVRADLRRAVRAAVGQPVLLTARTATNLQLTATALARAGLGGQDNFPAAVVTMRNATADTSTLNVRLAAAGVMAVDDSSSEDLPRKLRKELKSAQNQARKNGLALWAAEAAAKAAEKARREAEARERREARANRYSNSYEGGAGDEGEYSRGSGEVRVRGYYRGNGTYVAPYSRSAPSSGLGGGGGFSGFGGGRRR